MEISNTYSLNMTRRVNASSESDQQRNSRGSTSGVTFDNDSGRPRPERSTSEQRFDPLLDDRRLQGRMVTDARNQQSQQSDNQTRTETIQQKVQQAYLQSAASETRRSETSTATASRQAAYQDNAIDLVV